MTHELIKELAENHGVDVSAACKLWQSVGGSLGEWIVCMGILDEEAYARLVEAHGHLRRANQELFDCIPTDVIAAIPAEVACEFGVLPVARDADGALVVAMIDPCDPKALAEIRFFAGEFVIRTVAPRSAVRRALASHYGIVSPIEDSFSRAA